MPVRRAASIVLRTYKVGEADKIAVFFSLEFGKIRGMARGARRPRSIFGGSLELGTEVELTFFEKESRELVTVDRCDIVRSRFLQLGDPILASTLGYVTDLTDHFVPEREPNKRVYRLLRATVRTLPDSSSPEATARYFEAWLLRLGGLYPRHRSCPSCGRELAREGAYFLADEQRMECRRCLRTGVYVSPEAFGYLEQIWKSPPQDVTETSSNVLSELGTLHRIIIREQLEKELRSHRVLDELLRQEKGR